MREYIYELEMTVRDYELDSQGIVNNSVYQNYLEHGRHEFLKEIGLNFNSLRAKGVDAVVHKITMEFKKALTGDDRFVIKIGAAQEGNVRFKFVQDIYRIQDGALLLKGDVVVVFKRGERPIKPPEEVIGALNTYRLSRLK